jgi:hypothetical protein
MHTLGAMEVGEQKMRREFALESCADKRYEMEVEIVQR